MKNIQLILILLFYISINQSCSDNITDLNINENLPTDADPSLILPSIIFNGADILSTTSWRHTDQIMQYHTVSDFVNFNIYDFTPNETSNIWDGLYKTFGDIKLLESSAQNEEDIAYLAASYTLKAYFAATLTELWINVPFSEAGEGLNGNLQPKYDEQEEIYLDVLELLSSANEIFATNPSFIRGGDILYGGEALLWQKFTNSLRLRYLLRLSNVSSLNVDEQILSIIENPDISPIITNNNESAVYDFDGLSPNIASILNLTSLADLTVFNEKYVDYLLQTNDPRLDFFARFPTNAQDGPHVGIESGILDPSNQRDDVSASRLDLFFENPDLKDFTFISFSEVQFIKAEAALNGWTSEDPESLYESAIEANMTFWGLNLPQDYFDNPFAMWDGSLERLILQKWVSFYNTGSIEAWGDYKRTGLPALTPGPANVTNGIVPTRYLYPFSEQSLNNDNYNAASSQIGGDINTVSHWYQ